MIIRIKFEGTVVNGEDKSTITDHIDIHSPTSNTIWAKNLFLKWISDNSGIKGTSGIMHPLNGRGDIKIKSIEELKEVKPKKEKSDGKS
jgi:hypothetical protein